MNQQDLQCYDWYLTEPLDTGEAFDEPITECCFEELDMARRKENGLWVLIHFCPKCQSDVTEQGKLIDPSIDEKV